MKNIIMWFCRVNNQYSLKMMADKLGITIEMYKEMEEGKILINPKQAKQFADIFNCEPKFFTLSAAQLDLLLVARLLNKDLKLENLRLKGKLKIAGIIEDQKKRLHAPSDNLDNR